jgi:flagellar biosynthesis protein FlhF
MRYFTETAETHSKAIEKVREKYGDSARILMHKTVRLPGLFGILRRDGVEVQGYIPAERPRPIAVDLEEEKRKIIAQARTDQAAQQILQMAKDIQEIKERVESGGLREQAQAAEHPTLAKLSGLLRLNDFTPEAEQRFIERLKREFPLAGLDDYFAAQDALLGWIGEMVEIFREPEPDSTRARVVALVGPTGVGKTTTIAKLAATYAMPRRGARQARLRIVSIDNYRIGARQQMETYAEIMRIPFSSVETYQDLKKTVDMHREDADMLLVDTIGKSPRDAVKLAEMKEILEACGPGAEPHLAMSAGTKARDMLEIMRQFEPFGYKSVIITKLDETLHVGNILSALGERRCPVSFLTTGQRVPVDIERASAMRFLLSLEGFRVNRVEFDKRFPREDGMWKERD